jgi:DNA-binding LytR/AlgR family response regulator
MKKLNGAETALQIRQFNDKFPIVFVTSALDNLYEMMQSSTVDVIEKTAKKERFLKCWIRC